MRASVRERNGFYALSAGIFSYIVRVYSYYIISAVFRVTYSDAFALVHSIGNQFIFQKSEQTLPNVGNYCVLGHNIHSLKFISPCEVHLEQTDFQLEPNYNKELKILRLQHIYTKCHSILQKIQPTYKYYRYNSKLEQEYF